MSERDLEARMRAAGLDWIVPRWDEPQNVQALVTTRNGGASVPPYDTMNVGARADPSLAENRRRLREFLPSDPVWLRQVHGVTVARLDATPDSTPVADASVTRAPGIVCAVQIADCMPVLLADRAGGVVGIAHAGWRGLAAGVVEATLAAMRIAPDNVSAWLGPAIGPRAFEVGADVYAAFCDNDAGASSAFAPLREGKWHADLYALARRRLARAGVRTITGGEWCAHTERGRFFSYRRDGETGRMAACIWLRR
jgi:YfiH family protein